MNTPSVTAVTTNAAPANQAASATSRTPASAGDQPSLTGDDRLPAAVPRSAPVGGTRRKSVTPMSPKVLILTSEKRKLSTLSPFQRKEGCDRFGKVVRCDKLRDGGIEVEFANSEDAERALTASHFSFTARSESGRREVRLPINVEPHRSKNSSKGVIHCIDLDDVSDEDIAEGLADAGVIGARRIMSRKRGMLVPTRNIVLHFNQLELPREVTVGYVRVKVRPYVPSPMRCFRCLRFGHTRERCRNQPACGKCTSSKHTGDSCTSETLKCVNCAADQSPHSAFDPNCPAYLAEKEIIGIKVTQRLSFREARDLYMASHPKKSYATAVKDTRPSQPENRSSQPSLAQLAALLQAFGLRPSAGSGILSSVMMESSTPHTRAVSMATAGTQTSPTAPVDEPQTESEWTQVGVRRSSGSSGTRCARAENVTAPTQSPPVPPRPAVQKEQEMSQRATKERRLSDSGRTRLVDAGRSTGAGTVPRSTGRRNPETSSGARSSPMGPPPPPPPPPRRPPAEPPAPPVTVAPEPRPLSETPPSAPIDSEPPAAPGRPKKRSLPWDGSPTDRGSPQTRNRFQPGATGRAHSADGRLRQGHPRVSYGHDATSGEEERF